MKKIKSILLIIFVGALILSLQTLYRQAASKKNNIVTIAQAGDKTLEDNQISKGRVSEEAFTDSPASNDQDSKETLVDNSGPIQGAVSHKLTPEMVKSIKPGKAYQFDSTGNFKEFEPEIWDGVSDLVPGKKYKFPVELFDK